MDVQDNVGTKGPVLLAITFLLNAAGAVTDNKLAFFCGLMASACAALYYTMHILEKGYGWYLKLSGFVSRRKQRKD